MMQRLLVCRPSLLQLLFRGFAAKPKAPKPVPKFTESAAFLGRGSHGIKKNPIAGGYYASDAYNNKKIFYPLGSLLMLIVYFGWLREPSDLDDIWNTPPHILTANLERRMLLQQIKEAEAKGQSSALFKAQLEYVDVKEEALRIQFEQNKEINAKKAAKHKAHTQEVASAVVSAK